MPRPAGLAVVADAGGREQRRVHQRAGAHHEAARDKLARDALEQGTIQAAADQLGTEADEGGALGRRLVRREAAEPAQAGAIIKRLGQADVREIVPGRKQQRLEQRQRWPARLTLGRG